MYARSIWTLLQEVKSCNDSLSKKRLLKPEKKKEGKFMKTIIEKMNHYLAQRKAEVLEEASKLIADDRKDESNFLKARANIYDVFKALLGASSKAAAGDRNAFSADFKRRAATVPAAWRKSLEEASRHGDEAKILIEKAKLSAAEEIIAKFDELMEL